MTDFVHCNRSKKLRQSNIPVLASFHGAIVKDVTITTYPLVGQKRCTNDVVGGATRLMDKTKREVSARVNLFATLRHDFSMGRTIDPDYIHAALPKNRAGMPFHLP